MKEALKLRREKKKRKPKFVRRDYPKKKKLEKKWRQPKGRHSKIRMKKKGYRKHPSMGYSSPKKARGLGASGLREVVVKDPNQIKNLKEGQGVIIGKTGLRKKLEILKKIGDKKIIIVNVRDINEFIKNAEERIREKKKEAEEREEKKKTKKEEKKKEEKEKTEEEIEKEKKKEQRQKAMQQPIKK